MDFWGLHETILKHSPIRSTPIPSVAKYLKDVLVIPLNVLGKTVDKIFTVKRIFLTSEQ